MSETLRWLSSRVPAPPSALQARIETAVRTAEARFRDGTAAEPSLPALLAEAGLDQLRRMLADCADDAALELLAADALLTYACEAAAELGDDALEGLQAQLAPDRFAALLDAPDA